MRTLNLGILAHVDAGKTSLTERLLLSAGVIDELGSVDAGSTQTDSLALERRRGITIKSAVVSFVVDDVTINLIDTPGHPDFIAEVERVLSVLDGAVLVISAVEGVQAQTRILMRSLQRLRIPTLVFVNKIDRRGARESAVVDAIADRLATVPVPMGSVVDLGTPSAYVVPSTGADEDFVARLVDLRADRDAAYLASFVDVGTVGEFADLMTALRARTRAAEVCPVFFGSAITGAGVDELMHGIAALLPGAHVDDADVPSDAAGDATVFKVERGPAGEKIAYVRMFGGTIRTRERLEFGRNRDGKVTAIAVFADGSAVPRSAVSAGMIGKLWGLADIRIGDSIGSGQRHGQSHYFAPPTLETVVVPADETERGLLRSALAQLAEQDPLIDVRQDDVRQEISVSLYGEVQKEVIEATLADEFGVRVAFRESTTICVERPAGTGEAVEVISVDPNPFLATVGLRVEPGSAGSGVRFGLDVELGSMPRSFIRAVEDTVHETLREGLNGWQVVDCVVTLTRSGYWARQSHAHGTFDASMSSTAGDFRNLTPLVLMEALRRAGTIVEEPLDRFRLEIPADTLAVVLPALAQNRGVPQTSTITGSTCVLDGEVPAARMYGLQQQLPSLTRGEGVLEGGFERYEPVREKTPSRPRTDHDPLHRKDYLLRVQRRVQP